MRKLLLCSLLLAGCSHPVEETPKPYGYGDISLGLSIEDTLDRSGRLFYDQEDIYECTTVLKPCTLIQAIDMPYIRKNGVPYHLHLTFDKWAALETITLSHDSYDQPLSDCQEIYSRTAQWARAEYEELVEMEGTLAMGGNLLATMEGEYDTLAGERLDVMIVGHYIRGRCGVSVSFSTIDD